MQFWQNAMSHLPHLSVQSLQFSFPQSWQVFSALSDAVKYLVQSSQVGMTSLVKNCIRT